MSRFFIGQRVRIVRCSDMDDESAVKMIGREATIVEFDVENECGEWGNVLVDIDGNSNWCWLPEELEPITDCYDKTTWDECIWRPSDITV